MLKHIVTSVEYDVKSRTLLVARNSYGPDARSGNSHYASDERIERLLRVADKHQCESGNPYARDFWAIVPHTTGWSICHHRDRDLVGTAT